MSVTGRIVFDAGINTVITELETDSVAHPDALDTVVTHTRDLFRHVVAEMVARGLVQKMPPMEWVPPVEVETKDDPITP